MPILSLGDDVGKREIKCSAKSEISGEYVVEDISNNDAMFRRLIFLSNPYLVQSEAKLIKSKSFIRTGNLLSCNFVLKTHIMKCEIC